MAKEIKKEETVKGLQDKKLSLEANLKYMRDKDREKVRGKFVFHEVPGGCMEFSFRKYKEDQIETFKMYDGEIYEIPRGVAKHLNENLCYPIHSYYKEENGNHTMKVGQKIRRATFMPLGFMDEDVDLLPSKIQSAERVVVAPII